MIHLVVAPIVEGEGEERAVPTLLNRIVEQYCSGTYISLIPPKVEHVGRIVKPDDDCLAKAVQTAARKLADRRGPDIRRLILILIDAERRCAATLGPELKRRAMSYAPGVEVASVVAVDEYETWFVAAASSLTEYLDIPPGDIPEYPEESLSKQKWIEDRFRGVKYSKTVDQQKLTKAMDLEICRSRAPSFDKLCRDIERMAKADVSDVEE